MAFKNLSNEYLDLLVELYKKIYVEFGQFEEAILSGAKEEDTNIPIKFIVKLQTIFKHSKKCSKCRELWKIIRRIVRGDNALDKFITNNQLFSRNEEKNLDSFLGLILDESGKMDEKNRLEILKTIDMDINKRYNKIFENYYIFERHAR